MEFWASLEELQRNILLICLFGQKVHRYQELIELLQALGHILTISLTCMVIINYHGAYFCRRRAMYFNTWNYIFIFSASSIIFFYTALSSHSFCRIGLVELTNLKSMSLFMSLYMIHMILLELSVSRMPDPKVNKPTWIL